MLNLWKKIAKNKPITEDSVTGKTIDIERDTSIPGAIKLSYHSCPGAKFAKLKKEFPEAYQSHGGTEWLATVGLITIFKGGDEA